MQISKLARAVSRLRSGWCASAGGVLLCGSLLAGNTSAVGATWTPDPSLTNPELHVRLYEIGRKYLDANFDPDANLVGTPTRHPPNKKSHATRESAYYAYGLLLTGDPADRTRANAILKRVVATQDTTSDGLTKGAFGWYAEQPPSDLNSAAFVGTALASIYDLDQRHPCLDPDVKQMVENAGKLAVLAVMHRDVDPGYTNIALLSTALAAAGQKLWNEPVAAAWAEAKLDAVIALTGDGDYAEYDSPTYGAVDIGAAYMMRKFAFSDAFAAKADATIDHVWKQYALSYHAPTMQLGGPFCRAYGDNMLDYAAGLKYDLYLALGGAYPLPDTEKDHEWDKGGLVCLADVPITVRPEFKLPHDAWREWTSNGSNGGPTRHLSQYRDGNFILGTVAFQDEWKQKRHLVAYWLNGAPAAAPAPESATTAPSSLAAGMAAAPDVPSVGYCIDETNETTPGGYPPAHLNFYSQQVKDAALVEIVGPQTIPASGGLSLVFDHAATAADDKSMDSKSAAPFRVLDGPITTYLYPVTTSAGTFEGAADEKTFKVSRPWVSSDVLGTKHALAYLVVFRPADKPAPTVSGLALSNDAQGLVTAKANVDGADLSVTSKY
jgi:hypothetical protein